MSKNNAKNKRSVRKMIYNAGNRIMNTYVYPTSVGYIMIDTGYEHSLVSVEKKLNKQGVDIADIKYIFGQTKILNLFMFTFQKASLLLTRQSFGLQKRGNACWRTITWIMTAERSII